MSSLVAAGFHYSLWMSLHPPTADGGEGGSGGEDQIPTAFHHHLYSCQQPETPPHYRDTNSCFPFLENEARSKRHPQKNVRECMLVTMASKAEVKPGVFKSLDFSESCILQSSFSSCVWLLLMMSLTSGFSGWGLERGTHGTRCLILSAHPSMKML